MWRKSCSSSAAGWLWFASLLLLPDACGAPSSAFFSPRPLSFAGTYWQTFCSLNSFWDTFLRTTLGHSQTFWVFALLTSRILACLFLQFPPFSNGCFSLFLFFWTFGGISLQSLFYLFSWTLLFWIHLSKTYISHFQDYLALCLGMVFAPEYLSDPSKLLLAILNFGFGQLGSLPQGVPLLSFQSKTGNPIRVFSSHPNACGISGLNPYLCQFSLKRKLSMTGIGTLAHFMASLKNNQGKFWGGSYMRFSNLPTTFLSQASLPVKRFTTTPTPNFLKLLKKIPPDNFLLFLASKIFYFLKAITFPGWWEFRHAMLEYGCLTVLLPQACWGVCFVATESFQV